MTFDIDTLNFVSEPSATAYTDYQCTLCNHSLTYSGRGRKPSKCSATNGGNSECYGTRTKSDSTPRSSSSSKRVELALTVMEGSYDQLLQGLMLISPNGASALAERIEPQQRRNKVCFEGSAALTERVIKMGGKAGGFTFILSHLALVAVIARVAMADIQAQKEAVQMFMNMTSNEPDGDNTPFDLGKIFGGI